MDLVMVFADHSKAAENVWYCTPLVLVRKTNSSFRADNMLTGTSGSAVKAVIRKCLDKIVTLGLHVTLELQEVKR